MRTAVIAALVAASAGLAHADNVYFNLASGNFSQNWSNVNQITAANDWSGVPSILGYRGDDIITTTGVNPQTVLAFQGTTAVLNVIANQTNPNTNNTGGIGEFDTLADPVVALQGSGTADAPFLMLLLNSSGCTNINISYNLRDVDGSTDNAVQAVALQYRVGGTGNFIDVPAGFVADASSGPSLATLVTNVNVTLPVGAENASILEVRIITTNAVGNDEWIGVDDINVTSTVPTTGSLALAGVGLLVAGRRRR